MLGPDAEHDGVRPLAAPAAVASGTEMPPSPWKDGDAIAADLAAQKVHGRRADEARDEEIVRPVVEVERPADLLDDAVMHDDDLVGHGHGLDLVVCHIDGRGLQPLVQFLDLGAHGDAQLGVEIRQRLVEEEDLRDRARWRGPWRRAGAGRRKAGADSGRAAA